MIVVLYILGCLAILGWTCLVINKRMGQDIDLGGLTMIAILSFIPLFNILWALSWIGDAFGWKSTTIVFKGKRK